MMKPNLSIPGLTRRQFLFTVAGGAAGLACGRSAERNPDAGSSSPFHPPSHFGDFPCQYPAAINSYANQILGVSTFGKDDNSPNQLLDPVSGNTLLDLPSDPLSPQLNHFTRINGNLGILTSRDRIYEVTLSSPSSSRPIFFPSGNGYGGGAVIARNKLFVAVANLISPDDYGTGRVLIYDLDPTTGKVLEDSVRSLATTHINPTGMAVRGSSTVLVLNSGRRQADQEVSLDLIDAGSETIVRNIPLGSLFAQVSGDLALSDDGNTLIVGTAADIMTPVEKTERLLFVDLVNGDYSETRLPDTRFHSSVKIGGDWVYVTDFDGGTVTPVRLSDRAVFESIQVATGEAGPSEIYEGTLIQAVPNGVVRIIPK